MNKYVKLNNTKLDLYFGILSVFGSVDQVASDINVNCGYLSITKDYVISKNSLLIMETSNDYVLVNGDFITASL